MDFTYTIWIALLPLFMFLFIGLTGHKFKPAISGILGTTGLGISATLSYYTAYQYFFVHGKVGETYQKIVGDMGANKTINIVWLHLTDKLHIDMGVLLDPISVMMLVVITTVSLLW